MAKKNIKKRWTIINMEVEIKDAIVEYATDNDVSVARAVKELTRTGLRRWKKRSGKL